EYLESVLPEGIRDALWPFLDDRRGKRGAARAEGSLDSLLQSHESIMMNLEDLKKRHEG
ncbi:MAG: hypothetical protein HKN12_06860, partial [Gemmatimonadetes bacterium]|nr:hypothetical protein [Gemmatimonadota bacterium]